MVTLGLWVFYDLGLSDFLFAPLKRGHNISSLAGLLWGSDVLGGQETVAPLTAVCPGTTRVPGSPSRPWRAGSRLPAQGRGQLESLLCGRPPRRRAPGPARSGG